MGLRDTIQNNTGVGIAVALVCLLAAGYILFGRGTPQTRGEWYYDLETGEMIVHNAQFEHPPVTLPNGHQAVLFKRFACGECTEGAIFDGYLYKVTQDWVDAMNTEPNAGPVAPTEGELVASAPTGADEPQWFDINSARGARIIGMVQGKCSGAARLTPCLPQ